MVLRAYHLLHWSLLLLKYVNDPFVADYHGNQLCCGKSVVVGVIWIAVWFNVTAASSRLCFR